MGELQKAYKNLAEMRKQLLLTIFGANSDGERLVELEIMKTTHQNNVALATECFNFLESCAKTRPDFSIGNLKLMLQQHATNLNLLAQAGGMLTSDATLTPILKAMQQFVEPLKKIYEKQELVIELLLAPFWTMKKVREVKEPPPPPSSSSSSSSSAAAAYEKAAAYENSDSEDGHSLSTTIHTQDQPFVAPSATAHQIRKKAWKKG